MLALRVLSPTSSPKRIPTSASSRSTAIRTRRSSWSPALAKSSPDCAILVTSTSTDGNLILRAMRAGAKEFLTQPLKPKTWRPRCSAWPGNDPAAAGATQPRLLDHRRGRRHRRRRHHQPGRESRLLPWPPTKRTPSSWWTSTCAWAMPTCSSTRFPNTRCPTSPKTSRGSTSRCSSDR